MKVACIQMRSSDVVANNTRFAKDHIAQAASKGAQLVATPEMTNFLDIRQRRHPVQSCNRRT